MKTLMINYEAPGVTTTKGAQTLLVHVYVRAVGGAAPSPLNLPLFPVQVGPPR